MWNLWKYPQSSEFYFCNDTINETHEWTTSPSQNVGFGFKGWWRYNYRCSPYVFRHQRTSTFHATVNQAQAQIYWPFIDLSPASITYRRIDEFSTPKCVKHMQAQPHRSTLPPNLTHSSLYLWIEEPPTQRAQEPISRNSFISLSTQSNLSVRIWSPIEEFDLRWVWSRSAIRIFLHSLLTPWRI